MKGWTGQILRVDLTKNKINVQKYDPSIALNFLGGRGYAIKILWDELEPGIPPLSPENKLIVATGPLTGLPLPSSGKLVLAAKSPLTNGYGDGNIGSLAAVHIRKAGYDVIVITGVATKPSVLWIENDHFEIRNAEDQWQKGTFQAEEELKKEYGKNVGILLIGPAGENLVRYATIMSEKGRSGGRPGMGAVMGSKKLKAIVIKGSGEIPVDEPSEIKKLGVQAYKEVLEKPNYDFWMRQGTMSVVEWSQVNSVLPTYNFKEGVFDLADSINGYEMEKIKISQKGCPHCNMKCGNIVHDSENKLSELDYENVGMLGSNIGLGDLKKVATLNRLADDYGVDTISLGSVIGFAIEASKNDLLPISIDWGDFDTAKTLVKDIVYKKGIGKLLSEGTLRVSKELGEKATNFAMQVKGLEISAYDCHAAPAMALSFGTSPIGAHHKDAWVISWEMTVGRESYSEEKVDKVIELQRIRGGIFESLVVCRLPWVEVSLDLNWYPRLLKAATGKDINFKELYTIADRIYSLMRAFWVREYKDRWDSTMDTPPLRWFKEPLTKGALKGSKLKKESYIGMLRQYYEKRGWDNRGIPRKTTLKHLGLNNIANELERYVRLQP